MRTILAILISLGCAWPVAAQPVRNPLTFVEPGQWPQAQAAAAQTGDPIAEKLILYLRTLTPNVAGAAEIAAFIRRNPEWPLPTLMERRRQEAIVAERDNATTAALCTERQPSIPTPARGAALLRCADALANLGRGKEAGSLAREAWVSAISDLATETAFIHRFSGLISAADQWARFQRLAWDDPGGAQRQIPFLDPSRVAQASTRMALKAYQPGPIASPDEDPGAMLDLARALRKLGQDQAAVALWRASGTAAQKAAPDHLVAFWAERQSLARQLLHDGDARGAFDVVAAHGQAEPGIVAEAEFLAGFIALRRLNDPAAAARHFTALAAASPAVLTQSRAYYWLGRATAVSGGNPGPDYARAAAWPMTFYGQLAARTAGTPETALVHELQAAPTTTPGLPSTAIMVELARAARLLISWDDPRRARPFLLHMEELARTPAERIAVGDYAGAMGLPDVTVMVTRRLGRDGIQPPMQGWPLPVAPPPVPEPAVSLAIMRQESNFDVSIVSASGARGLMQLMPATARVVARRLGEPTSELLLTTDPGHNMRMGTAYLREMLEKFDNSIPLAVAAYNAGPHRVTQWLAENGDPRGGDPRGGDPQGGNPSSSSQDIIDWIEMIPFNETRNYVQRVLENIVVYQARRTGTLPVMMAQWCH
jgi:soluble lytic murein transglycosylase